VLLLVVAAACSVHGGGSAGIVAPSDAVRITSDGDRGITPDTITIGALVYRDASFAQFGLSRLGGRPVAQIAQPFVDDINEHGGIGGRRVVLAVTEFSPITPADMQTACVEQAQDKKVFATIGIVGFGAAGERCLASHQTPVVTSNTSSLASLRADRGWVRQTSMAQDRMVKDWIDWMVSSRVATPSSRVGVLHADTPDDDALVTDVMVPYLRQLGLDVVAQAAVSGDTVDTVTTEVRTAAQRFKDAHVDLVIPDLDFLRTYAFVGAAANAGLEARYTVSDLGQMSLDATTNFYPRSFDGTAGVTAFVPSPSGDAVPETPAFAQCLAIYQAHGQQLATNPIDRLAEELELAQFCEHLHLVARVAALAGPHLNRASFLAAFDRLGQWSDRVTLTGPLSFGPGKYDGPDDIAVIRWQADCGQGDVSCYVQVEPLAKGRW